MFDQFATQMQKSMQPLTDLMAVNSKMFEQLAQQQTALVSTMVNDGMAYAGSFSGQQQDVNALVEGQKSYIEAAQGKMTAAGQDAYAVMSAAQTQASEIVTSAFSQLNESPEVAPVVVAAAAKPASKAAPKAAK